MKRLREWLGWNDPWQSRADTIVMLVFVIVMGCIAVYSTVAIVVGLLGSACR